MDKAGFLRNVNSPWRMGFFLFWKLPAAWFMGIRVQHCDALRTEVRLPYGWRAQNPFRSIYFAAQCAAAELSTGLLALAALQDQPPVSMLVIHMEAEFQKKASETIIFRCEAGQAVENCIKKSLESDDPQTLRMAAVGYLPDETVAARVWVIWSFKRKKQP